jgi:ribonucleoside-diphosphate reductase alpha chain
MHGVRERLPNRRPAETFDIAVGGLRYTTTLGFYATGKLGEIFLVGLKAGSATDTVARDSAVLASLALQAGILPEALLHALVKDSAGRAMSPIGVVLETIVGEART